MPIDWFTVGAQVLNFLILVWLMKRFLYQPILHAIDTREQRIAAELASADTKKAEAKQERDEFQRKNEEIDRQRAALMGQATQEANAQRQRLVDEARKHADTIAAGRLDVWKREQEDMKAAVARRVKDEVFAITRKTLNDLAGAMLEERMSAVLTRRLHELTDETKASLGKILTTSSEPALVRSAFDLPPERRAAIQRALNDMFSADIRLRFETAPDLVSGIELAANGQKVAWSIDDYLKTMEKSMGEMLDARTHPEPAPEPEITSR